MVTCEQVLRGTTLTVITPKTNYTYRIQRVESNEQPMLFVRLLSPRSDTYLGKLDTFSGQVVPTAKSELSVDAVQVRLLNRVLARIWCNDHQAFEQFGYAVVGGGA